jgi:hypothetical protein
MMYRTNPEKTKGLNTSLSNSSIRDPLKVISPVMKTPFLKKIWPKVAEHTDIKSNHTGFIHFSFFEITEDNSIINPLSIGSSSTSQPLAPGNSSLWFLI